jgi:flagellar biosynthesis GTPase FlhF
LLIDSIQSFEDVDPALEEIRRQLCHSMQQSSVAIPALGVHVIAGPSGAGKSLMVARLAQHASVTLGSEQVAVISYSDQRAGAWNQTQLLSAQSGVDCFRATNATTLKLLLEEHGQRKFIVIDTPGVQMAERVADIANITPDAQFHVVIPADALLWHPGCPARFKDDKWASGPWLRYPALILLISEPFILEMGKFDEVF